MQQSKIGLWMTNVGAHIGKGTFLSERAAFNKSTFTTCLTYALCAFLCPFCVCLCLGWCTVALINESVESLNRWIAHVHSHTHTHAIYSRIISAGLAFPCVFCSNIRWTRHNKCSARETRNEYVKSNNNDSEC